jgi:hypothetical protein
MPVSPTAREAALKAQQQARRAKIRARRKERKAAKRAAEKAEQAAAIARNEAVQRELTALAAAHPEDWVDRRSVRKPEPRPLKGGPRRDQTYGGESVRTVSGGLPTLGRG